MSDHVFWSLDTMSSAVTVRPGDTVRWENRGNEVHNARADDGSFRSPDLLPGQSWSHTFTTSGDFRYVCTLHLVEEMFGRVTVQAPYRLVIPLVARDQGG